jgi:hypothetical protein
MRAPRNVLLVAALVFTASVDLFAQQEPPVALGDRVRVTAPTIDPDQLVGTLVALGADTCVLEVEAGADPLTLPLASVTSFEVSRGRESNTANRLLKKDGQLPHRRLDWIAAHPVPCP